MTRNGALLATALLLGVAGCSRPTAEQKVAAASKSLSEGSGQLVSAPGRVEPLSEEIRVSSEVAGRIRELRVEEGDRVRKGQVLAVISNKDYQSRVAEGEAELALRRAELDRLVNGAREQERREALAGIREAEALMQNAKAEMDRRDKLFQSGDISRSDAERTQREYNVAKARYEQAREHHAFVDASARDDDRKRALAAIAMAEAQLSEARARLAKTFLLSPVDGIVLRKIRHAGESVGDGPDTPVISVADDSVTRVRVDVDETDVGRIAVGQRAYVTADAYGDRKFEGHVVRVGRILGRKNVRTDEPTEKVDTKILETLVELNGNPQLPAGLRVDAFILRNGDNGQ